jgi:type II secretory pathway pseudopilin PulG
MREGSLLAALLLYSLFAFRQKNRREADQQRRANSEERRILRAILNGA